MDFKEAAENEDTCGLCRHNQVNKKVPNVRDGLLCMHEDNKQNHLHGDQPMHINEGFLCNRFEGEESEQNKQ